MYDLVQNMGQIPPCDSFKQGHQNDGSGHLWCVIANTPHGQIPAKVRDRHIFEGSFYAAEKYFSSKISSKVSFYIMMIFRLSKLYQFILYLNGVLCHP